MANLTGLASIVSELRVERTNLVGRLRRREHAETIEHYPVILAR